jgi:hypothetical protein
MEEYIVGDDGGDAELRGQARQLVETELVIWPAAQGQREIGAIAEGIP